MNKLICPCESGKLFQQCCAPLLNGDLQAKTAEALMRSRYAAYVQKKREYLLATWHQSTRPASLDFSNAPQWCGLRIVDRLRGGESDFEGEIEFKASYFADGKIQCMHERSRFAKDKNRWFYIDGEIIGQASGAAKKCGRNDPCPCGSGKKHKKCCGR